MKEEPRKARRDKRKKGTVDPQMPHVL